MKPVLATCTALFLLCALAQGQAGGAPERVVRRIIDQGLLDGHDHKVIGDMGDAAAVLVTKILAGRDLTTGNIDGVLVVFESSFVDPRFVSTAADREPRTALLVLKYLDASTADPALRKRISETREHVQHRYVRFLQDQPQK